MKGNFFKEMTVSKMKVLYMGTPDFAVAPLKALVEAGYDVCGVVTQPDKPVGRKAVLTAPPVKSEAEKLGIKIYQPQTLKNGLGVEILKELNPDIVVVVAYGKLLPPDFLAYPKYGCINIHGSVLPKYRGAAPIQRCVIDGEKYAGVTSMQMDEGLDTGDILLIEKTEIGDNETAGELFERLAPMGAKLLIKTLSSLEKGVLIPQKQDDEKSTYAKMLDKTMSPVDFQKSANQVHNLIRGLDPWPVALTHLEGKTLKLFGSSISSELSGGKAGETKTTKDGLAIFCGDGRAVVISQVQFEGKKRMNVSDFLSGHPIPDGTVLE